MEKGRGHGRSHQETYVDQRTEKESLSISKWEKNRIFIVGARERERERERLDGEGRDDIHINCLFW